VIEVAPDDTFHQRAYLFASPYAAAAKRDSSDVRFWVVDTESRERTYADTFFAGEEK
jgi:hypothetical protein